MNHNKGLRVNDKLNVTNSLIDTNTKGNHTCWDQ